MARPGGLEDCRKARDVRPFQKSSKLLSTSFCATLYHHSPLKKLLIPILKLHVVCLTALEKSKANTDEWMHGHHGEDCMEESKKSSVCRTGGSERELIHKMESCRRLSECWVDL